MISSRSWLPVIVDVGIDALDRTVRTAGRAARATADVLAPVVSLTLRPPLLPSRYWPQTRLAAMAERGRRLRADAEPKVAATVDDLVPAIVDAVLDRIDLTALVLERVDLDVVATGLDLDTIAARLDMVAIVDRLDLDAIAARLDLDPIVDRVPIDRVLARVDIDAIAAGVDIEPIIARVDVNAIAAGVDIDAILDRVDLAAIATQVIDEIDLPQIIRESSGAMASETVVGVRLQGIEADERVNRIVDRILLRRRNHVALSAPPAPAPTEPSASPASSDDGHDPP